MQLTNYFPFLSFVLEKLLINRILKHCNFNENNIFIKSHWSDYPLILNLLLKEVYLMYKKIKDVNEPEKVYRTLSQAYKNNNPVSIEDFLST